MLLSLVFYQPLDAIGRCSLPCGCDMADVFANVADGIATFCFIVLDGKPHFEIIDDIF